MNRFHEMAVIEKILRLCLSCGLALNLGAARATESSPVWSPVLMCDGAVVAHNDGPCNSETCRNGTVLDYRLAIKDYEVVRRLNATGAWTSGFGETEIAIDGVRLPGRPRPPGPISFRHILTSTPSGIGGTWIDVTQSGNHVRASWAGKRQWCDGVMNFNGCRGTWKEIDLSEEVVEFSNCHEPGADRAPHL